MAKSLISTLFFVIPFLAFAMLEAQVPTDLYLFQLQATGDHTYHVFKPQFLSGFNPGGYTNQPWFTPDGDLLVSVRKVGEKQNDIYSLSLANHSIRKVTETSANEYSPRLDPSNKYLSVVRQVEGNSIDQQVFRTLLSGGGFKSVTPDRKDIGYYTWLDKDQLALFRIDGETVRLEKYNILDQKARKITSAVGRTLLTDENGSVLYVHKFSSDYWYLKKYNPRDFSMDILVQTPGLTEDFALAADGTYFMGLENKLFCYHPEFHTTWHEIADLNLYGIDRISRLAVSPDGKQLALVAPKSN